jgi:threonylcarbamoyladenosine tRNA methylthiotransferase MtaB
MPTVAYYTLGCKVNQYETEQIRQDLERAGCVTVSSNSRADAYVINTCSVTGVADSKSRAAIRRAVRLNPDAVIAVTGCYAQLQPGRVADIEGVDLVFGNDEKEQAAERILARLGIVPSVSAAKTEVALRRRTRALVKVQDGCDQFCAYCIVPLARARKYSRPIEEIRTELEALASCGYREVVLTGIRLGSYENGGNRLPELVRMAADVEGIERIRLSSIEPWEVDASLLDAMDRPKVCRHLHIPLQSGDDDILSRMGRPYTAEDYLLTVENVRKRFPDVGITTDVIAGFPGETEEAFENTLRMVTDAGFTRLHVFRYSQRPGTLAAQMTGQVPTDVRKRRADELIRVGLIAMADFASRFVGRELAVLIETTGPTKLLTGFADNYVEVNLAGDVGLKGRIVRVKITGVNESGKATGKVAAGDRLAELGAAR